MLKLADMIVDVTKPDSEDWATKLQVLRRDISAPPARFLLRRRIANSTSSTSISDSRILSQQLIDSDACSLIVSCEALRDSFEEHSDRGQPNT